MLPVKFIYTENGKQKSSLDEHKRRCDIMEHNKKLSSITKDEESKTFKQGDRVYHRNLKLYGTFVGYAWESEEECDVCFEMEDGEIEQKHVSVKWLDLADSIKPILAANGKPIKYDKGLIEFSR